MEEAVKIKNLSVRIDKRGILHDISARLSTGHIIGLLGPSGAGKTTLIRVLVGRQTISRGEVEIFGQPSGASRLRGELGYMTQSASVYQDLTAAENVRYFARMSGRGKPEADKAIADVRLTRHAHRLVGKLSGGEKSRVSLAIALIGRPKLLILDEPTVGVDPVLRAHFWELFKQIAGQGTTILVTSHVMDEAEHCDDLLLIRDGRLLAQGSPAELKSKTGTKTIEDGFLKLVEVKK